MLALADEWQWQLLVLFYSYWMYCLLGELRPAESQAREALEMNITKRAELLRGYTLMIYSMILQLKDEQDALPLIMEELMAIGEKNNYKYILGFGKRLAALTILCREPFLY